MSQKSLTGGQARVYDLKEKPRLESIRRCEWPTGCLVEAADRVIDFGFNPPVVRALCKFHSESFLALTRKAVKERLKP